MFAKLTSRAAFVAVAAMLITGQSASAATYANNQFAKFYKGTTGYTGAYSGVGTVYDMTKLLATNCPTTGNCNSDILGTTLSFDVPAFGDPGVDIVASVNVAPNNKVWDDLAPNFGGLGVGTGDPSDTDQIAGTDILTLTFAKKTILTGVGTLFDAGHTAFGANFGTAGSVTTASNFITFLLSVDGGAYQSVKFKDANTNSLFLMGKTFAFKNNGAANPDFYVNAVATVPVPLPAALPLLAAGLGGLARFGRRAKA